MAETTMQIVLLKVPVPKLDGKYQKMDVLFERDGKPNKRKVVAIGKSKDIFPVLTSGKEGDVFDIDLEKEDGSEFWNWVGARLAVLSAATSEVKAAYVASKNTYETPEERARKQVYITRHGALNTAVEYLTAQGKKFSEKEVMDTASLFASFVFQTNGQQTIDEVALELNQDEPQFKDDIPF